MRGWVSPWAVVALLVTSGSAPCLSPASAFAAQAEDEASASNPTQALEDFIHFVIVAKDDIAVALGRDLLGRGLTPEQFVGLVEDSGEEARFREALGRASQRPNAPELNAVAEELRRLFESGLLDIARNPSEIDRNIDLLTGSLNGRRLATERLTFAGEYAAPQLLEAMLQGDDLALRAQASRVLVGLGPQAVAPLSAALTEVDPVGQELIARTLGRIPYAGSLPALREVAAMTPSAPVREAAVRAIEAIDTSASSVDPAALYRSLAEAYLDEREELTSFPAEDFQLLWDYNPGLGLIPTPIRTEVYHEAMAMRLAERAMRLGAEDGATLAVWVAANYSREIDTPQGYENPAWPADRRGADYFGVAAGVEVAQRVLARGIEDRDTPLARRAIAALERTAGAGQLWARLGDRRPLLDALLYPSRRVQYEAALALGRARPTERFDGAERVVPILASAVRDASASSAVVFTRDVEQYQGLRALLESMGFDVLPRGESTAEIEEALSQVAAVDVAIVALGGEATREVVSRMRSHSRLSATPTLALLAPDAFARYRRALDRDPMVSTRTLGLSDRELRASLENLLREAAGGAIDAQDARDYRRRALEALRDLAVAQGGVFAIEDATGPLISALEDATGPSQLPIAEVLSRIGRPRAQAAILEAAMAAPAGSIERIELLNRVADSSKRFGRMVSDQAVDRLVDVASEARGPEATAAAAAVGAMNLDNRRLLRLIRADDGA